MSGHHKWSEIKHKRDDMTMQKTGDAEKLEVLVGKEAQVLNKHMAKLGKYKVSDFSKDEKDALTADLEAARPVTDEDQV